MTIPSPQRWATLSPLLDELLDLDEHERSARLLALRQQDEGLAAELQELLDRGRRARAQDFLTGSVPLAPEDAAATSLAGQRLGAYVLEEALGHGGGGSVWRARREDGRFEGAVAVKLLHLSLLGRAGAERFRREGHILARLTHPHIARLLDAGVTPGQQPYLVLELVQGERIDRYCDAAGLDIDARLALFDDVLAAVAHAHTHGVIHRDLKPGNILVDHGGRVKLLDFGVAKLLNDEADAGESTELTREGGRALTPEYAAPEQLRGEGVTTATDVYALGVVLFQLLVGRHPTAPAGAGTAMEVTRSTLETEPPSLARVAAQCDAASAARRGSTPQRLARTLAGDLETIVAQALRKAAAERYVTVTALADDLRRYREHLPVHAQPASWVYRARKFVRRHRGGVAAGAFMAAAVVAGVVGTTTMALQAQRERDQALEEMARVRGMSELNHFMLQSLPDGKPFHVAELLDRGAQFVEQFPGLSPALRAELLIHVAGEFMAHTELGQARAVLERAYVQSRTLADVRLRAQAACLLASLLAGKSTELDRARQLAAEGLAALGNSEMLDVWRIDCLMAAADVESFSGQGDTALPMARRAQMLADRLQPPNLRLKRESLERVAAASRITGQIGVAAEAYRVIGQLLVQEGREKTEAGKTNDLNQGALLVLAGQPLEAQRVLGRAMQLASQPGATASPAPPLLGHYARSLAALSLLDDALRTVQQAQHSADAAKDLTAGILARMTQVAVLRQLGRWAQAQTELDALRQILAQALPPGHYVHGLASLEQAQLELAQGRAAPAMTALDQGIALLRNNRSSGVYLPQALLRRGEFLAAQGRLDEATAQGHEAAALLTTMLGPDMPSAHKADAARLQGLVHRAQGQASAASQNFEASVGHYKISLGTEHPRTREVSAWALGGR